MRRHVLPDGGVTTVASEEERLRLDHFRKTHPGPVSSREHRVPGVSVWCQLIVSSVHLSPRNINRRYLMSGGNQEGLQPRHNGIARMEKVVNLQVTSLRPLFISEMMFTCTQLGLGG